MKNNNVQLIRPEYAWVLGFEKTPTGNGVFKTDPIGVENRNVVAAQAVLSVPASAASNTALTPQALDLLVGTDLPSRFLLMVWNGSDANVSVSVEDAMVVGGSTQYVVVSGSTASVNAKAGVAQVVECVGFGDGPPQVSGTTTSAATSGGSVTVQLRFV